MPAFHRDRPSSHHRKLAIVLVLFDLRVGIQFGGGIGGAITAVSNGVADLRGEASGAARRTRSPQKAHGHERGRRPAPADWTRSGPRPGRTAPPAGAGRREPARLRRGRPPRAAARWW
jgi:hypothetical protein